jgi:DNA replication protein DnaC
MKTTNPVDAARLALLLAELRLPAVKLIWGDLAAQADKEGWPAARFLAALAEHEMAERGRRRIERHLAEAKLPPGKTIDTSTLRPSQWSARPRSWRSPPAMPGWARAPI